MNLPTHKDRCNHLLSLVDQLFACEGKRAAALRVSALIIWELERINGTYQAPVRLSSPQPSIPAQP